MSRPRRKNDRLILAVIGLNTAMLLVNVWYQIQFQSVVQKVRDVIKVLSRERAHSYGEEDAN